jgi:hypothetical protein
MIVERLARAGLRRAARRWPDELAEILRAEWAAELDALRGRPWRMLTFAGSLVVSPAVDEPSWRDRAVETGRAASTAAGVTLLAAALFNGVHVSDNPVLLLAAAAVLAVVGLRVRMPGAGLLGLALFAFLLAGNEVAVMPFMGVRDIAPAVIVWTVGTALTLKLCRGRPVVAAAGTLITLDLATMAGSWHAADVLGRGLGSAPAWFPLALHAGGDDLLLVNASAMAGPMMLCSVFAVTSALRGPRRRPAPHPVRILAGAGAALGSLAFCEWMSRSGPTPPQLLDNSFTFGFGFAVHPAGSAAVALLIALLVVRVATTEDPM